MSEMDPLAAARRRVASAEDEQIEASLIEVMRIMHRLTFRKKLAVVRCLLVWMGLKRVGTW